MENSKIIGLAHDLLGADYNGFFNLSQLNKHVPRRAGGYIVYLNSKDKIGHVVLLWYYPKSKTCLLYDSLAEVNILRKFKTLSQFVSNKLKADYIHVNTVRQQSLHDCMCALFVLFVACALKQGKTFISAIRQLERLKKRGLDRFLFRWIGRKGFFVNRHRLLRCPAD